MDQVLEDDARWMGLALQEAQAALQEGEVPVGAVIVKDGRVVATGRNRPVASHDPSAHAEVAALRSAGLALGNYRLDGCELFVTLEPCPMCAGALLHARVSRVVYGAADPRTGAAGSVVDLFAIGQLNHQTQVTGGVRHKECAALLQSFFRERRERARRVAEPLRDDALRTPGQRFESTAAGWPAGREASRFAWLDGLRLHYVDAGPADAPITCVCLHGPGEWSHYFRNLLACAGPRIRLLMPDLIGFGRSDKPKRVAWHELDRHCDLLQRWLNDTAPGAVALVHSEAAREWAVRLRACQPQRFACVVEAPDDGALDAAESLANEVAWQAPFPDSGHQAALAAFGAVKAGTSGPSKDRAPCLLHQVEIAMGYSTG